MSRRTRTVCWPGVILILTILFAIMGCVPLTGPDPDDGDKDGDDQEPGIEFTVNAGEDRTVNLATKVELAGSVSNAPGTPVYAWSFVSRPAGASETITDSTLLDASFYPSKVGAYTLKLSATYGETVEEDTVVITVVAAANIIPEAELEVDKHFVTTGTEITLTGRGGDYNFEAITYTWTVVSQPEGSEIAIEPDTDPFPFSGGGYDSSIKLVTLNIAGTYVFRLTVSDGKASAFEEVTVTAEVDDPDVNAPPVANAGPDATVNPDEVPSYTLDGSKSGDADSIDLTYSWECTGAPEGDPADVTVYDAETSEAYFYVGIKAGDYTFTLTVSDGETEATDTVVITVTNEPPQVDISDEGTGMYNADSEDAGLRTVVISVDVFDPNDDELSIESWRIVTQPAGAGLTAESVLGPDPDFETFTLELPKGYYGEYVIEVTVTDGELSGTASLRVVTYTDQEAIVIPELE